MHTLPASTNNPADETDKVFAMIIGDAGAGNSLSNSESREIYPGWGRTRPTRSTAKWQDTCERKITNNGGTKWYDISAGFWFRTKPFVDDTSAWRSYYNGNINTNTATNATNFSARPSPGIWLDH